MKKKLLPSDYSDFLAKREHLSKKEAEAFVRAFFEVVEQGLLEDRFVKIKGFGTFKLVAVSERESVNISTGERFQISGHSKVSFTPDPTMKELVNRPFAHFESVDLTDDTDIEEIDAVDQSALIELEVEELEETSPAPAEETPAEEKEAPAPPEEAPASPEEAPAPAPQVPEPAEEEERPAEEEPLPPVPEPEEKPAPVIPAGNAEQADEDKPAPEEPREEPEDSQAEPEEPQAETEPEAGEPRTSATVGYVYQEVPTTRKPNRWKIAVILIGVIALMTLSYYAGYFRILCPGCNETAKPVPQRTTPPHPTGPKPAPAAPQKPDTVAPEAARDSAAAAPAPAKPAADASRPAADAPKPAAGKEPGKPAPAQDKPAPAQAQQSPARPKTHTIRMGENLHAISRRYYGSDKYVNAIIEANGIEDADHIHVGATLRLP